MAGVHLSYPPREHDRLDPFPSFAVRESQTEGPGKPLNYRLSELVAVIGSAVARLDLDGQGVREVGRVREGRVLPRQFIARYSQVPYAVGCRAGDHQRPPSCRLHVPYPAAGACFGPGEGGHAAGEVVRLRGEYDVARGGSFYEAGNAARHLGQDRLYAEALYRAG